MKFPLKCALGMTVIGASTLLGALIINGPAPKPEKYMPICASETCQVSGPVQITGYLTEQKLQFPDETNSSPGLEVILRDNNGDKIACHSSSIEITLLPRPMKGNAIDNNKLVSAYTALIRNETKPVTIKGVAKKNKVFFYELEVAGTNYSLLRD